jgi:quercetin dioxygenase-like cupin family protein
MAETRPDFSEVRRVVTGHDPGGKSVVLIDGAASNSRQPDAHTKATILWVTDASPTAFAGEEDGATIASGFSPPPGGSRFGILDIAPGNRHFMHRTDTVDYVICLEGTVQLVLDDSEVMLRQGDVVIQRGTNHAWVNRSDAHARIAFVLLDALPKREGSL